MNKITKIAIAASLIGLGLLVPVTVSGITHPNPLFNYGAGLSMLFVLISMSDGLSILEVI